MWNKLSVDFHEISVLSVLFSALRILRFQLRIYACKFRITPTLRSWRLCEKKASRIFAYFGELSIANLRLQISDYSNFAFLASLREKSVSGLRIFRRTFNCELTLANFGLLQLCILGVFARKKRLGSSHISANFQLRTYACKFRIIHNLASLRLCGKKKLKIQIANTKCSVIKIIHVCMEKIHSCIRGEIKK